MFFGDGGENNYLTKIMMSCQWDGFQHWLLNIIEQNREKSQFNKVLEHLPRSLAAFVLKQWHEIPTDEQVKKLVGVVMSYLHLKDLPIANKNVKHAPPLKIRGLLWRS